MVRRAIAASFVTAAVFAFYVSTSGAPVRVHVATAVGLLAAFWVPALWVGDLAQLWKRRWRVLAVVLAGLIVYNLAISAVVGKAKFPSLPLYPIGFVGIAMLLLVHLLILRGIKSSTGLFAGGRLTAHQRDHDQRDHEQKWAPVFRAPGETDESEEDVLRTLSLVALIFALVIGLPSSENGFILK